MNRRYFLQFLIIVLGFCQYGIGQDSLLQINGSKKKYRQQITQNPQLRLVEVRDSIPGIVYDLRYATTNNFTGTVLYNQGEITFLRLPALKALASLQRELKEQGLGIKIFDAYRPHRTTRKMWDLIRDERYVASPSKGSNHNRGLAIDLTIIRMDNGQELDMGTGFDNFTDTAHHNFISTPEVMKNRKLLRGIMEKYGFRAFETEWWHYSWPNDGRYDVMDLDFKEIRKANKK